MQLTIIVAIVVTLVGGLFAMQNNVPVTMTFLAWHFDGSLATVILLALAVGAGVTILLMLPTTLKRQWLIKRQKRRIDEMEKAAELMRNRIAELDPGRGLSQAEVDAEQTGYVGLKQLITGR